MATNTEPPLALLTQASYLCQSYTERVERSGCDISSEQDLNSADKIECVSEPVTHTHKILERPVLIPRVGPRITFPFARAWAPALESYSICQHDWLQFVDSLNLASRAHPVVVLLELCALGMEFVPIDGADGIAALLELIGSLVARQMATSRLAKILQRMNGDSFHPRALHAHIVSAKSVKRILGLPKDATLIAPLTEDVLPMTVQERNLAFLSPFISPLAWDVPPVETTTATAALRRVEQWRMGLKVKAADRGAKRSRKRTWKKMNKGKKVKWEALGERQRATQIKWLVVQDVDDFKQYKAEKEEERHKSSERQKKWNPFHRRRKDPEPNPKLTKGVKYSQDPREGRGSKEGE